MSDRCLTLPWLIAGVTQRYRIDIMDRGECMPADRGTTRHSQTGMPMPLNMRCTYGYDTLYALNIISSMSIWHLCDVWLDIHPYLFESTNTLDPTGKLL